MTESRAANFRSHHDFVALLRLVSGRLAPSVGLPLNKRAGCTNQARFKLIWDQAVAQLWSRSTLLCIVLLLQTWLLRYIVRIVIFFILASQLSARTLCISYVTGARPVEPANTKFEASGYRVYGLVATLLDFRQYEVHLCVRRHPQSVCRRIGLQPYSPVAMAPRADPIAHICTGVRTPSASHTSATLTRPHVHIHDRALQIGTRQ